jgi:amphi-Trp domain-containing protein
MVAVSFGSSATSRFIGPDHRDRRRSGEAAGMPAQTGMRLRQTGVCTLAYRARRPYGRGMELIEITRKERLSREDVARRLHALADDLARHNDVELERGGTHVKLRVPDEVNLKFELEIEDDGTELEIELSW